MPRPLGAGAADGAIPVEERMLDTRRFRATKSVLAAILLAAALAFIVVLILGGAGPG